LLEIKKVKIDTTFVEKLLPNQNNYYSWLRVVMDKWEKSYPGTMEILLKMTEKKKFLDIFFNKIIFYSNNYFYGVNGCGIIF
jgi:hypothetical protein